MAKKKLTEEQIKELEILKNKEVGELYDQIVPDTNEAYQKANAVEKRQIKKENEEIYKLITAREKEFKDSVAELPKYEPELVANSVESMGNSLFFIPNEIVQQHYIKLVAKILDQKPQSIISIINAKKAEAEKAL